MRGFIIIAITILVSSVVFAGDNGGARGGIVGPSNAFKAEIYDNDDLTNLKVVQIDKEINFQGGAPAEGVDSKSFSIRWTGKWRFEKSGEYIFNISVDDGIKIWIDGQLVLDRWFHQVSQYTLIKNLRAGYHGIKVEYKEEWGAEHCKVSWALNTDTPQGEGIINNGIGIDDGESGIDQDKIPQQYRELLRNYFKHQREQSSPFKTQK